VKTYAPLLALYLLVMASGNWVSNLNETAFQSHRQEREAGDIMLDVFGEFRTVMARYLWFKMDLFHEVLDDEGVAAEKQAEVMALLRMISLLDPSITEAYDMIAWDLYRGHGDIKGALAVLDEGIRRNPESVQLQFRRSMLSYTDKQYEVAEQAGLKASELATDEFDILNSTRLVYWSAKHLGHKDVMRAALARLSSLRPTDALWIREKAELEKSP
jgi:hypothetical protein